MKKHK
jgi:hypothetical protein